MVICNFISDKIGYDEINKDEYPFINFCYGTEDINPEVPTIYYGYNFSKEFHNFSMEKNDYGKNVWVYSNLEADKLGIKTPINLQFFYEKFFNEKFNYEVRSIDLIYNSIEDMITCKFPILHKGNHEIYCLNHNDSEVTIYSIKRDNIEFCGEDYNLMFSKLVDHVGSNCLVLTWEELPNKNAKNVPLCIDILLKMWYNNRRITWRNNYLYNTKYNLLYYFYYTIIKKLYSNTGTISESLSKLKGSQEYKLEVLSRKVSNTLSNSEIKIDKDYLFNCQKLRLSKGYSLDPEISKLLNNLTENDTVFVKYHSDSTTSRMYNKNSSLNFITLDNDNIKKAIIPKKEILLEIDISSFEFSIVKNILNLDKYDDIHTEASNILQCNREFAKTINSMVLYGSSNKKIMENIKEFINVNEYLYYVSDLLSGSRSINTKLIDFYNTNGYIKNYFGRIVHPKNSKSVFNNYVQSTASDIINFLIFYLSYDYDIIGYKFDSLLFDVNLDDCEKIVNESIIVCKKFGFDFKIAERRGESYYKLG